MPNMLILRILGIRKYISLLDTKIIYSSFDSFPIALPDLSTVYTCSLYSNTRWFKYNRDYLRVNKSQFVPVIF